MAEKVSFSLSFKNTNSADTSYVKCSYVFLCQTSYVNDSVQLSNLFLFT